MKKYFVEDRSVPEKVYLSDIETFAFALGRDAAFPFDDYATAKPVAAALRLRGFVVGVSLFEKPE